MLIHIDNEGIEQEKESIKLATSHLNTLLELLNKQEVKLTQAEIKKLPDYAEDAIMDNLRKRYPFKKADDAFNLEALGIDLTEILDYIKENSQYWLRFDFNYSDGVYTIDSEKKYLDKYYHYAKTEQDKKIVLAFDQLAKTINELAEMGVPARTTDLLRLFPYSFTGISLNSLAIDYITVDGKKLSGYLSRINLKPSSGLVNANQLTPKTVTASNAFKKLDIKHITERYKK